MELNFSDFEPIENLDKYKIQVEWTCKECGKKFIANDKRKRKYCSEECKKKSLIKMNRKNREAYNERHKKCKKSKNNSIQEVTRKAREKGMTYGQYVALEYAKQVKVGV